MSDIFISYAREDRPKAQLLARVLEERGWSVFWDRVILPGQTFETVIGAALAAAKCTIVLWSRSSIASNWVKDEAFAAANRQTLVPVMIEDIAQPLGFGQMHAANLSDWDGASAVHADLGQLLNAVAAKLAGPLPPVSPEPAPHPAKSRRRDSAVPPALPSSSPTVPEGLKWGVLAGTLLLAPVGIVMGLIYMNDSNHEKKEVGKLWLYTGVISMVLSLFSIVGCCCIQQIASTGW